jgi:1,4-dihydroxy-2-naphthoate octaprenyltransferase
MNAQSDVPPPVSSAAPSTGQPDSRLKAWYKAARPRSLTATYIPLTLAAVIALDKGVFDLLRFVLSLIAALLLQIGANLVNEYFDYIRGADSEKQAGMGMVIKDAVLTPRAVLYGAIATVGSGIILGLILTVMSGPVLLLIGLGGVLVVVLYTAGPVPLAYIGLGEVAVFVFMGPLMVLGAYYVMSRELSWTPVLASLPVACLVAAILHANNVRDLEADRAVSKRTLAVIFGRNFARAEYFALIGGAYVALIVMVALDQMPWLTLAALITLQEARRLIQLTNQSEDPQVLHMVQGRTARLHRDFGVALIVGWLATLLINVLMRSIS